MVNYKNRVIFIEFIHLTGVIHHPKPWLLQKKQLRGDQLSLESSNGTFYDFCENSSSFEENVQNSETTTHWNMFLFSHNKTWLIAIYQ